MSEFEHDTPSLSPAEEIDARAVTWFLEQVEGEEWTDDVRAQFEAWLAESPKHRLAYWRVEAGWEQAGVLADVRPPADLRESAGMRAHSKAETERRHVPRKAVAGAVAVAVLGFAAALQFTGSEMMAYSTPVGGHKTVTLADGSRIELDTNTLVQVADGAREAKLVRGEAYFEVKHNAAHPFVVRVGDHRITDLGTEFVVRKAADRTTVGLVKGSVRLASVGLWSDTQLATLTPGEIATVSDGKVTIAKDTTRKLTDDLAWRTGRLVFRHATLGEVAAEFNRYNTQKLVISDPRIASIKISSTFPSNRAEVFARMAHNYLGLHVTHRNGEIVISP